ncbi:MAG: c-type cytochrome biogenesis protein CcsB [Galactobacter sp.]
MGIVLAYKATEINLELGRWSELLMLLACIAYAAAFIAYTVDLIRSSRTVTELEASLKAEEAKELVGVGQATRPAKGGASSSISERTTHRNASVDGQLVDDDMSYDSTAPRRNTARISIALFVLAAAVHLAAVVTRSISAGRVPWGNMYEFLTTGALVVAVVYLVSLIFKDFRFMGMFIAGLVVIMMCAATMGFPTPVQPLIPALQSPWLIIHVSIAVLGSAMFAISFALSVLQLVQTYRLRGLAAGKKDKLPWMRMVPSAVSLENMSYRVNAIAFVMWTATLILGAIWAEAAWGRYWGWDVKEVWTFIIWVVYAGYLHARATRGWTGVPSAWLSIIGFGCVVFNFTAVNIIFPGFHSYAGV